MTDFNVSMDRPIGLILDKAAWSLKPSLNKAVFLAATFAGGAIAEDVMDILKFSELARSFLPAVYVDSSEGVAAGALSKHVAARILDQGGVIRPKTAKSLAIPISKEAKTKWPRDWPKGELTLVKSKKGNALLAKIDDKEIKLHYLLTKSVTIQPRHYIEWARGRSMPTIRKIMAGEVVKGMEEEMGKV